MSVKSKINLLRDLLYLEQVFVNRQISAAAEKNGIKAANLSLIIKNLEKQLGITLFIRNASGVIPTQETISLIHEVEKIDHILSMLIQKIDPSSSVNDLKVYMPQNLKINGLENFLIENNIQISSCLKEKLADVIVSYEKPQGLDHMVCVENQIGQGVSQMIYVLALEQPMALKLAQFIISRMHAQ